jgi:nitroreductase
MDAFEAMSKRRSVRKYRTGTVSREQISQIVNAGRLAPTGRNEQPWEFVIITNDATLRKIAHVCENGRFVSDVLACVVVLCRPTTYYIEDGSAATTQMLIAATALGLASCWIAGDKKPYAPQIVALCDAPPEYRLVSLVALGHGAESPNPTKRTLSEVVHWESFKHSAG